MEQSNLKILVVDDEIHIANATAEYLENIGFDPIVSYTAEEAMSEFKEHSPLVCVLDIKLPGTDGMTLLKQIMTKACDTQVIMLTGYSSMENVTEALRLGACDFLLKPINFEILLHAINKCYDKIDLIKMRDDHQRYLEEEVTKKTRQIKEGLFETIRTLGRITRFRDPYTQGHEERVVGLSKAIAKQMGYSDDRIKCVEVAAILHDVGKIAVPAEILVKPIKPTKSEFSLLKDHVIASYEIIKDIPFKGILGVDVAEIVYQHHERIDGSGYPRGLKGDEILEEAKILAVADMVESMSSHRPYRAAISMTSVIKELSNQTGVKLDKVCAETCMRILRNNDFKMERIL